MQVLVEFIYKKTKNKQTNKKTVKNTNKNTWKIIHDKTQKSDFIRYV